MRDIHPFMVIGTRDESAGATFAHLYVIDPRVAKARIEEGNAVMVPDEIVARRTLMLLSVGDAEHFRWLLTPPDPNAPLGLPDP